MKMRQVAISSSLISDRSGRQSVFLNVECWAGRLAQLVEHRLYTPAVRGSSPLPPISSVHRAVGSSLIAHRSSLIDHRLIGLSDYRLIFSTRFEIESDK